MEYVKGAVGFGDDQKDNQSGGQSSSGMLGGKSDKVSSVSGGGDNGDSQGYLDKGITALQQSVMGTGSQNSDTSTQKDTSHHGAVGKADVDEAHDENISAFIREKYRTKTEEAENGPKLG